MRTFYINRKALIAGATITATITIAITVNQALAEITAEPGKPLALQNIMSDMGKNMQTITYGVSREDWALVEKTAPLIADYPQPPLGEKVRILAFVGRDAGRFNDYDEETRDAARALGEAAARENGYAIISHFATLQNSCLRCHRNYRESFQQRFYEKH